MMNIEIEYPFLFFKRRAKGAAPTKWGELTERQFIAISRTIHGAEPDYRFLSVLTGVGENLLKKLSPFALLQLTEGIDFMNKAGNLHSAFIIREIAGTDFVAPKPKLDSLTFGQFIFADAYYNDWMKASVAHFDSDQFNSDQYSEDGLKALNNLIATLYLMPSQHFTSDGIADRVWTIINVDLEVRQAIAFNYGLIMIWLRKCYPLVFREPIENDDRVETVHAPSLQTSQSGWLKLFEQMVGDDIINRERYAELPIHTVLRHLTKKYKENARR